MVNLDVNRRPGYSLVLRADYFLTINTAAGSSASVYLVRPGQEPVTLASLGASDTVTLGPYTDTAPLMVVVNAGQASVSDPVLAVGGGGGGIESIVAGANITVNASDPANPIISASGDLAADWDTLENKPAVIAAGDNAAEAREAIGAGTSNLALGTTNSTAKAGDYQPAWSDVTDKPTTFPPVIGSGATDAMAGNTGVVLLAGDQSIAGIKTFTTIPVLPASNPSSDNEAARKAYVDGIRNASPVRNITASAAIDVSNHLGRTVESTASEAITVTLADDLPDGSEGVIIQGGNGVITVALETGDPVPAPGASLVSTGLGAWIAWKKTANAVYVTGDLADA